MLLECETRPDAARVIEHRVWAGGVRRPGAPRPVRVALLEDSESDAQALTDLLTREGYSVTCRSSGDAFLALLDANDFDLFILNWAPADMVGFEVLRKLRGSGSGGRPVLMLTSRTAEFDLVHALEGGANDCLVKPWRPLEMLARLKVMLRPSPWRRQGDIEVLHGYGFEASRLSVHIDDQAVALRTREFELARMLFRQMGQVLSRQQILHAIWHSDGSALGRSLDTHISRLRGKLQLVEARGFSLRAVYGMGYRLDQVEGAPDPR